MDEQNNSGNGIAPIELEHGPTGLPGEQPLPTAPPLDAYLNYIADKPVSSRRTLVIQGVLFALTVLSTVFVGLNLNISFYAFREQITVDTMRAFWSLVREPYVIVNTLWYVLALLGFLTTHEMGHYLMCRRYGIRATLPFYLPNPLFFGTLGAVIRIKSPIRNKRQLFDIGFAGPASGFIVALPILVIGLFQSLALPATGAAQAADSGFITLGEPLLQQIIGGWIFQGQGAYDLYMSPLAMVGWFACLVTALNLLPASQLDGGHILYAVFGRIHKWISIGVVITMVSLGVITGFYGWLFWAIMVTIMRFKHPRLSDEQTRLNPGRYLLALAALAIFVLCFMPVPIQLV